jgi:hypothetical protein
MRTCCLWLVPVSGHACGLQVIRCWQGSVTAGGCEALLRHSSHCGPSLRSHLLRHVCLCTPPW